MKLFISQPGKVAVVRDNTSLPGSVTINPGGFSARTIITGLGVSQNGNVQFQHSLKNAIYVYSFGDRMGAVRVSGLGFSSDCTGNGQSGVEGILRYYADNRVSENGQIVEVRVGSIPLRGYLIACEVGLNNPELLTYQWSLTIATLPETRETTDSAPLVPDAVTPPMGPTPPRNNGDNSGTSAGGELGDFPGGNEGLA